MKKFITIIINLFCATVGMQAMEPINFSWVQEGKIAGMACPKNQANVEWLKAQNIGLIVTLTENSLEKQGLKPVEGIEFCHIQVPNMGVPSNEDVDAFIQKVNQVVARGKASVVHCQYGVGRTGTFLACWLGKELKLSGADVIKELRARRSSSISTYEQEAFVVQYLAQK